MPTEAQVVAVAYFLKIGSIKNSNTIEQFARELLETAEKVADLEARVIAACPALEVVKRIDFPMHDEPS